MYERKVAGRGDLTPEDLQRIARKGYVGLVVSVIVWGLLVHFVPDGTPTLLVNVFFLVACVSWSVALYRIATMIWTGFTVRAASYLVLGATILVVRYVVLAVLDRVG